MTAEHSISVIQNLRRAHECLARAKIHMTDDDLNQKCRARLGMMSGALEDMIKELEVHYEKYDGAQGGTADEHQEGQEG